MKFAAIIFDLDGTLVDSYPGILESLNETLLEFGRPPVDLQTVKRMVGRGLENLIRDALGEADFAKKVQVFKKSYDRAALSGTLLLPQVTETLRALHSQKMKMAVASNKPAEYTNKILQRLNISDFFIAAYGPEDVDQIKPHPAMLNGLMRLMQVKPDETLYVGDMMLDADTARNAGVKLALISTGGHSHEELASRNPDYLLSGFSELLKVEGLSY